MKFKIILTTLLFMAFHAAFAQGQPFGHLTIFSEDGDKFYLILNGEKINDVAQTNLRVEDLTQPFYNAKMIFEDKTKNEISKNFLPIADADGIFMDVTYKLKRDRNNASKMKLNFFSMIPVDRGFIPASNVHVVHFGQPAPPFGTISQTTTTTTSVGGVNAGVNVGGIGVNISINDPYLNSTVTQTSTTHTTTNSNHQDMHQQSNGCAGARPMMPNNFSSALQTITGQGFDDTRLNTAKQIASANCLNATQIAEICKIFGFEETKLNFAKFAYTSCTDPNNYFMINNVFAFSTSVDELTQYTGR